MCEDEEEKPINGFLPPRCMIYGCTKPKMYKGTTRIKFANLQKNGRE